MTERYVVRNITGHILSGKITSRWWVADTLWLWREVYMPRKNDTRAQLHAEQRCAELNAEHAAWEAMV